MRLWCDRVPPWALEPQQVHRRDSLVWSGLGLESYVPMKS